MYIDFVRGRNVYILLFLRAYFFIKSSCITTKIKGEKNMNQDIKQMIKAINVKQYEVAYTIGIAETPLCVWLRRPLEGERRERTLKAIEELRAEQN